MNISALILGFPTSLVILFILTLFVIAVLVLYALRTKGDVFAEFSHGSMKFRLEAKDRMGRRTKRSAPVRF